MGTKDASNEVWASGDAYEPYVGRWSRLVAQEFVPWLGLPQDCRWLDVGCGTGALSQTILELAIPKEVKGIDRSERFVEFARKQVSHRNIKFEVGDAQALPVESASYDVAVSGLILNFVAQPDQMVVEMKRAVRKGGTIALYVWDYAGKMQLMRHFWNAAAALDSDAHDLDEGRRSLLCNPQLLMKLFQKAGLSEIETHPIDISTDFKDFDDFWSSFLGGQGPAPSYVMSLREGHRAQLRERIYNSLPFALDGSIPLVARAWAVRGVNESDKASCLLKENSMKHWQGSCIGAFLALVIGGSSLIFLVPFGGAMIAGIPPLFDRLTAYVLCPDVTDYSYCDFGSALS